MSLPAPADDQITALAEDLRGRAARSRNHAGTLPPNDPEAIAARGKARGFDESAAAASRLARINREKNTP